MKNRILSLLLALVLVFALAVNASAAETTATNEMPDLNEKGSLTITMDYDGQPLNSGKLNVYWVGSIVKVEENTYDFRLFEGLERDRLSQEEIYDPLVASQLLTLAKQTNLKTYTAPITEGKAVFTDLNTGLYLVWQDDADKSDGLSAIQPFLISVPRWYIDHYAMDVESDPKVPIEKPSEPTTEPTKPTIPDRLPQTGQLNWPIPVMALSGSLLFIVGCILCLNRKRR